MASETKKTKLTGVSIVEVSGVDDPANENPGWAVMKARQQERAAEAGRQAAEAVRKGRLQRRAEAETERLRKAVRDSGLGVGECILLPSGIVVKRTDSAGNFEVAKGTFVAGALRAWGEYHGSAAPGFSQAVTKGSGDPARDRAVEAEAQGRLPDHLRKGSKS